MNKFKPSRPFVLIFSFYLLGLALFSLFRLSWLFIFSEQIADISITDILTALFTGIRFDQIIILYTLVPWLFIYSFTKLSDKISTLFIYSYYSVVYLILLFLLLADIRFYQQFDTHLNFLAFEYIGEGDTFSNLLVAEPYFYLVILMSLILTIGIVIIKKRIFRRLQNIPRRISWLNQISYFVLFVLLFAMGIRGRLSLAPMDWGVAYKSNNHFVNQLALNGIYTLGRNLTETNKDPRLSFMHENNRFEFTSADENIKEVQNILHQENQQWLEQDKSLLRLIEQPKSGFGFAPNIILVIMESWPARFTGVLGSQLNLTPNLDSLASNGIVFSNFYASGIRTNYGLAATLCSFPSLPGRSIMKRYDAHHPFISFSEILHERGYFNCFVYGGDLAFDNMLGFFIEKKYDKFYSEDDFSYSDRFSKWGVPDQILFDNIIQIIDSLPRPFQLTTLTLSNHEPFDLPDSSMRKYFDEHDSSKVYNSLVYADYSVGYFIDQIKEKPVFDSTIFVFISDHCRIGSSKISADPKYFHIPLVIYSPLLTNKSGIKIHKFGSQVDFIPTFLSLLGGDYFYQGWGRNLFQLADDDDGFAVYNIWNRLAYLDSDLLYIEETINSTKFYQNKSPEFILTKDSLKISRSYLDKQNRLRRIAQSAEQQSTPDIK